MPIKLVPLVFACLAPAAFAADWETFQPSLGGEAVEVNLAVDPVRAVTLGSFHVELEKLTLQELIRGIGIGQVVAKGDASEYVASVCVTAGRERVWFGSSEIGGGTTVDLLAAVTLPTGVSASAACPELPKEFMPVRMAEGAWLGASSSQVRERYGVGRSTGEVVSFGHIAPNGEYSTLSSASFKFRAGKVTALSMSRVTTN